MEFSAGQQIELTVLAVAVVGAVVANLVGAPTWVVLVLAVVILLGLIRVGTWLLPLLSQEQR